jgi:hypothetical protein
VGFNRREMEVDRKAKADAQAAARRAFDAQVLEDAERLIAAWKMSAKSGACHCCSPRPQQEITPAENAAGALKRNATERFGHLGGRGIGARCQ